MGGFLTVIASGIFSVADLVMVLMLVSNESTLDDSSLYSGPRSLRIFDYPILD